jgi:hypothetical protein
MYAHSRVRRVRRDVTFLRKQRSGHIINMSRSAGCILNAAILIGRALDPSSRMETFLGQETRTRRELADVCSDVTYSCLRSVFLGLGVPTAIDSEVFSVGE